MEITEIIKEAFIFPSQNLEKFVKYILLTFAIAILVVGGTVGVIFAVNYNVAFFIITFITGIVALALGLILSGYQVTILKSGIDKVDAPEFDWMNDLVTGIKLVVVGIVYFIIPLIITLIVALITNLPGHLMNVFQRFAAVSSNGVAMDYSSVISTIPQSTLAGLGISIAITFLVAFVLFVIFAFLYAMGVSRLANTGDLGKSLNIIEAFNDITEIGVVKVFVVILISVFIVVLIQVILSMIYGRIPQFSILSVIVTPYLTFFMYRVMGLLYSDIA